jgi:hypothetical protein
MTKPHTFPFLTHVDRDIHTRPSVQERVLNEAIVRADISAGFEEYLEIFDTFYAEDVEVSSGIGQEAIRGKTSVRSLLLNFLIPLHIMAEIGGLSTSLRTAAIASDLTDETHSEWTFELVAPSGRTCTLTWRTFRKWSGAQVLYEHHYDHQQIGGPLTYDDLSLDGANLGDSFPKAVAIRVVNRFVERKAGASCRTNN